jgi:hypothetical protein
MIAEHQLHAAEFSLCLCVFPASSLFQWSTFTPQHGPAGWFLLHILQAVGEPVSSQGAAPSQVTVFQLIGFHPNLEYRVLLLMSPCWSFLLFNILFAAQIIKSLIFTVYKQENSSTWNSIDTKFSMYSRFWIRELMNFNCLQLRSTFNLTKINERKVTIWSM